MANAQAAELALSLDWESIPAPTHSEIPQGCIWGLFDQDGKKDKLGTLNYLTPEHVKSSAREIETGERVQLDWSLDNVAYPGFKRQTFKHSTILKERSVTGWTGCDDILHFNTQSGSQWDGLQHVAHQATSLFYNNLSVDDIKAGRDFNGIDDWVKAGGIAGRAVLLDWLRWYEETTGKEGPDPCTEYTVSYKELEEVAKYQGTELKPRDILLVRFGLVRWHNSASDDDRKKLEKTDTTGFIGVKAEPESVKWFWNHHFAAVASDTLSFESFPLRECMFHEWFLAMWGTPIGELWDLEKLSEVCVKHNRWSFFMTSAPLNVPHGIASTPNAIAMF